MSSVISFHDNSGAENMPPDHHYSSQDNTLSGDGGDFFDENPFFEAVFCYGWLFVLFYCLLCRKTREPPSTEVGDRIRARARAVQERIQQKKLKEELSPAERKRVVDENMITKMVLSKDADGNLSLGEMEQGACDDDVESQQQPNGDCSDKNITQLVADDDEGATCVICLDCFEPGDLVSWTKHDPTCRHVFHDECIRQWLEERRQDECPSCRCNLVPPLEVPTCKSVEEEEHEETQVHEVHTEASDSDSHTASRARQSEPKEESESELFAMINGFLNRATSISRSQPSAPASRDYNLVSVNSGSFDSQESTQQVQEPPTEASEHQTLVSESISTSSSGDSEQESNERQYIAQADESCTSFASVETMSISEALRQSEVMDDNDEEIGGFKNRPMELGMQDAVTNIVFSPREHVI